MSADAALTKMAGQLTIPIVGDANAPRETISVGQLQGVSLGTAIACVLRADGQAFSPEVDAAGKLQLRVRRLMGKPNANKVNTDDAIVIWPVGWTPTGPKRETLPKLFDFFEAEVDDFPLTDTLAALSERLDAPVLYDHWALARKGIAPEELRVSQPPKRIAYSLLLRNLLRQAELKYELRVDEAERPLLWITTR